MPIQRLQLVNNELYHIILRGVGDSLIFKDVNDYYRGVFSIYEFNTSHLIEIRRRREERKKEKASGSPTPADGRDLLVEILAFCFMPNHIHLLVRQLKENGISQFLQKVGTGYAVYFNKKYNRKGHFFNKFKSVHIGSNDQLKNIFTYIHCNPLSLIEPGFKEKGIEKTREAVKFLEEYKWSSYQDYIGIKNFPSVTKREFLLNVMDGEQGCRESIENWITYKRELNDFNRIPFLE